VIRPVTMLAGVTVVLVILIAPYLRPWLAQRSDIADQQARVQALQRQVDELTAERNRWNDPTYVRTQAREKLNFVMPGELGYVVLDDGRPPRATDPAQEAALQAGRITGRPWYDVLWQSVQLAGGAGSTAGPTTGTSTGTSPTPSTTGKPPAGSNKTPTPSPTATR
jgi:hypothetical protein